MYHRPALSGQPGGGGPGARALVLLGGLAAEQGDCTTSDQRLSQAVTAWPDPETIGFAEAMRQYQAARRDGDWKRAEGVLAAAAEQWRGSAAGAWAALRLAETYRFDLKDPEQAAIAYRTMARDYAGTEPAVEALLGLGDCLNWDRGGLGRGEGLAIYEEAFAAAGSVRMQMRALLGMGDCLWSIGEYAEAYETLTRVVEECPIPQIAASARALRAVIGQQLGYSAQAAEDARAFLAAPGGWPWHVGMARIILGSDAFRRGEIEAAEREYLAVFELSEDEGFRAEALAGIGHCRAARGDWRGAVEAFVEAAGRDIPANDRCRHLYEAARAAEQQGDKAGYDRVLRVMVEEFPGSHLTTQLVGHELLDGPAI